MRRVVGVVERNAVERHAVLAVLEAAVERLRVAEAGAVRADAERARRHLQHLAVVGERRRVVADVFVADERLRGARSQRSLRRRRSGRGRQRRRHRDRLRDIGHAQLDGHVLGRAVRRAHGVPADDLEARHRDFNRVQTRHQTGGREMSGRIGRRRANLIRRFVPDDDRRVHDDFGFRVEHRPAESRSRLCLQTDRTRRDEHTRADDKRTTQTVQHITHFHPPLEKSMSE